MRGLLATGKALDVRGAVDSSDRLVAACCACEPALPCLSVPLTSVEIPERHRSFARAPGSVTGPTRHALAKLTSASCRALAARTMLCHAA